MLADPNVQEILIDVTKDHVYAVDRTEKELIFYVDGEETWRYPNMYLEDEETRLQYPFSKYNFDIIYKSYDEIPGNLIDRSTGNNGSNNIVLYGPDAWAQFSDTERIAANGNARILPIQPGDVKWKDVNGDGVIDQFDRVKIGNTRPRWTGGFNSTVSYKNLTLSARMDYGLGFHIADWRTPWILGNMQGTFNMLTDVKNT